MAIRFQADADLNQLLVSAVIRREPKINFQTAFQAKLANLDDLQVLQFAADEQRIIVTHDRRTMPYHFAEFVKESTSSGVIIVSQQISVHQFAEDILLIWSATEMDDWTNRIAALPF